MKRPRVSRDKPASASVPSKVAASHVDFGTASRYPVYRPPNGPNVRRRRGIGRRGALFEGDGRTCTRVRARAYMRMHGASNAPRSSAGERRTDTPARERGEAAPCAREEGRAGEGPRSNKFRAGKNGTGGLREIDGATREVREREGRPVSGLSPALRSDSDHQTRKSRHPESPNARAPSPARSRPNCDEGRASLSC